MLLLDFASKKTIYDLRRKGHTIQARQMLTFFNMVNVPSSRKATTKEKTISWDLKGKSLRSRSSKRNALTVGSKVTNKQIVNC